MGQAADGGYLGRLRMFAQVDFGQRCAGALVEVAIAGVDLGSRVVYNELVGTISGADGRL